MDFPNNNNNNVIGGGTLIPFNDSETGIEERNRILLQENDELKDTVYKLELAVDRLEKVVADTQNLLNSSQKQSKDFKSRYINSLVNPIRITLNNDTFLFRKEYSDDLFLKYQNVLDEGAALLKFSHGKQNINETNEINGSFIHKFSFGEIVNIPCSQSMNPNCQFEAIVVFEHKNKIEYLTDETHRIANSQYFALIEKDKVSPLQRRVICVDYINVFRMSYLRTKHLLGDQFTFQWK